MQMDEYIATLIEQIRCKKAIDMVADEVKNHITDQAEVFEAEGMEKEDALEEAVRQMGDPVEAGVGLDRIHRPKMEWSMLLLIGVLSMIGLVLQYIICNAGNSVLSGEEMKSVFFQRQCLYTVLGFLAMIAVYFMDYSILGKYPLLLWFGYFALLVIGINIGFVRETNGQSRIYNLLTIFILLYAGVLYRYRKGSYGSVLICASLCILPGWMALRAPMLSVVPELAAAYLIMLSFAISKGWFNVNKKAVLAVMWTGALVLPALLIYMGIQLGSFATYQAARLEAFLNPHKFSTGAGYQRMQVLNAVAEFKLLGSTALPADIGMTLGGMQSDWIVIALFSYFGILIGTAVLLLIAFLIIKAFRISIKQKNQLGAMAGLGCSLILFLQSFTYIIYNFGIGPLTPRTLPLLSFGGQSTIVTYLVLGVLLSIHRHKDIISAKSIENSVKYRLRIEKVETPPLA